MAGAGLLGKVFSGGAKGASDQRLNENQQRLQQQQIHNNDIINRASLQNSAATTRAGMQNSNALDRAGLDLSRKSFQQTEPNVQARQALTGSLMSRIQPLQMTGLSDRVSARMPKMNSIIDAIGPEARQAGSLLAQRGLSGLQSGGTQFADLPPVALPPELNLPPATLMALQKSGLLEKIMGGLGLAGSIAGALGEAGVFGQPTINGGVIDTTPPKRNW
jgi:hypothetical protein